MKVSGKVDSVQSSKRSRKLRGLLKTGRQSFFRVRALPNTVSMTTAWLGPQNCCCTTEVGERLEKPQRICYLGKGGMTEKKKN